MGVAGSGKTTVGGKLAAALGWPFFDADDFHSNANKSKMAAGLPLEEQDRLPWLERLSALISRESRKGVSGVLACSALREVHRQLLGSAGAVMFIYLKADRTLIERRLRERRGHYMPVGLVRSQFDTLEEPTDAIEVSAALPPQQIVESVCSRLGL
jgi:gluconokinase